MLEEPQSGIAVRKLRPYLSAVIKAFNALFNFKVNLSQDVGRSGTPYGSLQISDANAVLDLHLKPSSGTLSVTDGTTTVDNVTRLSFNGSLFTVSDGGDGLAIITLQTEACS